MAQTAVEPQTGAEVPDFHKWLAAEIKASGKSWRANAKELGLRGAHLWELVNRRAFPVSLDGLDRIADHFGAPAEWAAYWRQQAIDCWTGRGGKGVLARAGLYTTPVVPCDGWLLDFREWLLRVLADMGISMQEAGVKAGLGPHTVRGSLRRGHTPLPRTVKALVSTFGAPPVRAERWIQGASQALKQKGAKIKATRELRHPEKYRPIESVCLHCGKPLPLWPSQVGRKKYCSKGCKYATRRTNLKLTDLLRIYLWREMAVVRRITSYGGIANAWGMSYGGVSYYFTDERRLLTRASLEKIAAYLDVEAAYLVSLQGSVTADDRRREMSRDSMLTLIETLPRGPLSAETRAKISAAHQGKSWSPERKAAYHEAVLADPEKVGGIRKAAGEAAKKIERRLRVSLATYRQHLGREPTSDELESFAARKVRELDLPAGSKLPVLNLFKRQLGRPADRPPPRLGKLLKGSKAATIRELSAEGKTPGQIVQIGAQREEAGLGGWSYDYVYAVIRRARKSGQL